MRALLAPVALLPLLACEPLDTPRDVTGNFDVSYEDGEYEGLGIVPGKVIRFPEKPGFKVPHMGWNTLQSVGEQPLLANIPAGAYFYFVHSYYVVPDDPGLVAATSLYGTRFCAAVARDNVFACQFHPEKSHHAGARLLERFLAQ